MMMGYIPEGKGSKGDWGGEKFIHPTKRALQYPLIEADLDDEDAEGCISWTV